MKNHLSFFVTIAIISISCSNTADKKKIAELRDSIALLQNSKSIQLESANENFVPTVEFGGADLYLYPSESNLNEYKESLTVSGQIDSATAANKLYNYKLWRDLADDGISNSSRNWKKEIYGNLFTWNEFRDFVLYVRRLRETTHPDIDGIRIYAGATFYRDGFIPDVFLMPTINTKNIIDIDPDFPKIDSLYQSEEEILDFLRNQTSVNGDDPIFNFSQPCPHDCN